MADNYQLTRRVAQLSCFISSTETASAPPLRLSFKGGDEAAWCLFSDPSQIDKRRIAHDAVATNGILTPGWRPGTGTYSVNPDCTGTQTIVMPGMPDLHLQFIVAQSGNTIHQVVTDPGVATTAEGERVRAPEGKD